MDKVFLGRRLIDFTAGVESQPFSRVDLVDTEGNLLFTAGDNTGRTLTATHRSATQAMADHILTQIAGYVYRPYDGRSAYLDPAAELGDGVTVADTYVQLVSQDIKLSALFPSDISAPELDEIEDDFPYTSPTERKLSRQIKKSERETVALITKTDTEIRLLIENEINGLSSSFTVELDSIKGDITGLQGAFSTLELDLDGLTTRVQDAEGNIAELELTTQGFGVSIEGLEGNVTELRLDLDGLTVTDDEGTTKIKGSSIETSTLKVAEANISGTLSAKVIDATNLKVAAANITGTVTAGAISIKDAYGNNLLNAGGNAVKLATWNVDNNSLFSGDTFDTSDVYLCTGSVGATSIAGSPYLENWVFKAGANFGVQKDGTAYMSNAIVQGTVTANYGKIGPWTVGDVTLYNTVGSVMYSGKALYATDTTVNYTVYLTPRYLYLLYGDARTPMAARWSKIITMAGDEA